MCKWSSFFSLYVCSHILVKQFIMEVIVLKSFSMTTRCYFSINNTTAFMGYCLSLWTNESLRCYYISHLLSAIPFIGNDIVPLLRWFLKVIQQYKDLCFWHYLLPYL